MKLTFVIGCLEMGGAQRVALNLIRAWRARDWSVDLVVTYSGRGSCYYEIPPGVNVIYLADLVRPNSGWPIDNRLRRTLALRRLLREQRPDCVVSFLTDANVFALAASLGLGLRVIVSERSYPPADRIPWFYAQARLHSYGAAAKVVMQTERGLEWLARAIPTASGVVIPNPITLPLPATDPLLSPNAVLAPGAKLIFSAGRLVHEKGFDVLIEAFRQVAERGPEWQLVIVGEGPARPALERQVQHSGLNERVFLLGSAGNIGDWFARAEIFALTSRYEGFPNTLLEAMAHGCAVVSFDCDTGPADIIVPDYDGLLLGPLPNAPELAGALLELMVNERRRRSLSIRARGVLDRFSMDAVLAAWDATLGISAMQTAHACVA